LRRPPDKIMQDKSHGINAGLLHSGRARYAVASAESHQAPPAERRVALPPWNWTERVVTLASATIELFERLDSAIAETKRLMAERAELVDAANQTARRAELQVYADIPPDIGEPELTTREQ
jgi:hypothetical protein